MCLLIARHFICVFVLVVPMFLVSKWFYMSRFNLVENFNFIMLEICELLYENGHGNCKIELRNESNQLKLMHYWCLDMESKTSKYKNTLPTMICYLVGSLKTHNYQFLVSCDRFMITIMIIMANAL